MVSSKKAQSGAAILIALIAALIILYVLFLPPADRAALLGESTTSGPGGTGPAVPGTVIIYSSPVGRVVVPSQPVVNDDLQSITIRTVEQGSVLAHRDTAVAESNVFEKKNVLISFTAQPNLTRNSVLSLNLQSITAGELMIKLNGQEVYNRAPLSRTIPPITLSNLQPYNELELSASSVGFSFWRTNRITMSGITVTGDVTDISGASATQRFTINQDDLNDVDRIEFAFVPICSTPGPITIMLNGVSIFEGPPDCENRNIIELAAARLHVGENTISWSTSSGDMLIDLARVTITSKKQQNPVFTFQIDPAQVQGRPILLRVAFADATNKQGFVTINGNRMPIQGGSTYGMPITTALRPGANTISFEASSDPFEVVRFDVVRG